MSPRPTLDEAVGLHQSGRLEDAEKLYHDILEREPDNPDALHLLGVLNLQRGDLEDAKTLIVRALDYAAASILAPFGYCEIIMATTIGFFVFGDFPDSLTWTGIAIVIGAGIYVSWRERKTASTA